MNQRYTEIAPTEGWKPVNFKELWAYRDLLYFLVYKEIKGRYAQSVIGVGWAIIQPLVQTLIFTVVFGNLAKLNSDGVPYLIFSYTGMVMWNYFSSILTASSSSILGNKGLYTKVYFPRLILPFTSVLSKFPDFLISSTVLAGLLVYFEITPNLNVLALPLLLLILMLSALGGGMIIGAMAVQYRDVQHALSFFIRLLMYSVPLVYSLSLIPEKLIYLYSLNPMVGVIEGMRAAFLGTRPMPWDLIGIGFGVALLLFTFGSLYFKRVEKYFADIA